MDNRGVTFKIVAIIFVTVFSLFSEDGIFAKNPFLALEGGEAAYFDVVQDDSGAVWVKKDKELYCYSAQGLKKYAGSDEGVKRVWGYDTLYALCERAISTPSTEKSKIRKPSNLRVYTLEKAGREKFEILEEASGMFAFFLTRNKERLLITDRGEIKLNGKILLKLDASKSERRNSVGVNYIRFVEDQKGNVWFWSTDENEFTKIFEQSVFLLKGGLLFKADCSKIGINSVMEVVEPEYGTIYLGQYYRGSKGLRLRYEIAGGLISIVKDSVSQEKTLIPLMHLYSGKKLWLLSRDTVSNAHNLFYYAEGAFVKHASDVGGPDPYFAERQHFMLESDGNVWLSQGSSEGLNIVASNGNVRTYDYNYGVRTADPRQFLTLKDGSILLVNATNNKSWAKNVFQVLSKNAPKSLAAMKVEKAYEEFRSFDDIKMDSKGHYYFTSSLPKMGILRKYDGTIVKDVVNPYEFKKELEKEKTILKTSSFSTYGLDSDDNIWLVFVKSAGVKDKKYAVLLKDGKVLEVEDLYKLILRKTRANAEFKLEFIGKSENLLVLLPDTVLAQCKGMHSVTNSMHYDGFNSVALYKEDLQTGEATTKIFSKLENKEFFLHGFNKTPDGRIYLTTWGNFSERSCYVFEGGEWKKSGIFYPNQVFDAETRAAFEFKEKYGVGKVERVFKCADGSFVFYIESIGLFIVKGNTLREFPGIYDNFLAGGENLNAAYIDKRENIWLSCGQYAKKTWLKVPLNNIAKVTNETSLEALLKRLETTVAAKQPVATSARVAAVPETYVAGRQSSKEFTVAVEPVTGEVIELVRLPPVEEGNIDLDAQYKIFVSGKDSEVKEAETVFLENGSLARKYLEEKKLKIKDEMLIWKIDALLSRFEY